MHSDYTLASNSCNILDQRVIIYGNYAIDVQFHTYTVRFLEIVHQKKCANQSGA